MFVKDVDLEAMPTSIFLNDDDDDDDCMLRTKCSIFCLRVDCAGCYGRGRSKCSAGIINTGVCADLWKCGCSNVKCGS